MYFYELHLNPTSFSVKFYLGESLTENPSRKVEWRSHYSWYHHVCVQAVRGLLENPNEPVNELSYFDCIESVMENSKVRAFQDDYLSRILKLSRTRVVTGSGRFHLRSRFLRSLESRWLAFLSTARQATWWPLGRASVWRPRLSAGWRRRRDRWDHDMTPLN